MVYKSIGKKIIYFLPALALVTVFFGWILLRPAVAPVAGSYLVIGGQKVSLEIADTPEARAQGLSNHSPLGENQGMLFVFPDRQVQTFWMKDMLFPLDIIWLDGDRIIKISPDLPPGGAAPGKIHSSDSPVNRVLEINAGWALRHNLKIGDIIKYHL